MKLKTGREFEANYDIVGINADGIVFQGYDGGIEGVNFLDEFADKEDRDEEWPSTDRIALADEMIARWSAFRMRASGRHG